MIYKDSKRSLLKEGLIKKCPVDYNAIANLRVIIESSV